MNRTAALVSRAYRCLLRCYPPSFRDDFAEMDDVFAQASADAAERGGSALAAVCLRELATWPGSVGREWAAGLAARFRREKGELMETQKHPPQNTPPHRGCRRTRALAHRPPRRPCPFRARPGLGGCTLTAVPLTCARGPRRLPLHPPGSAGRLDQELSSLVLPVRGVRLGSVGLADEVSAPLRAGLLVSTTLLLSAGVLLFMLSTSSLRRIFALLGSLSAAWLLSTVVLSVYWHGLTVAGRPPLVWYHTAVPMLIAWLVAMLILLLPVMLSLLRRGRRTLRAA